jgi:hypothetical protein
MRRYLAFIFLISWIPCHAWARRLSDLYAFVSYDDPTKVTLIMTVQPHGEPSRGPDYAPFDDTLRYEFHIDNSHSAADDLVFQVQFSSEIRTPSSTAGFLGAGSGITAPPNSPPPVAPGTPIVPPAITALEGAGAKGINLRQKYTVTLIQHGVKRPLANSTGGKLYAVPSNVGPRTMPDYPALAAQGIYDLSEGIRVFAGTVDDPFFADSGALYDTLNFRIAAGGGVLTAAEDANDQVNIASDSESGFNVNCIALEVPIALLTKTGTLLPANQPAATIGVWATAAQPQTVELRNQASPLVSDQFIQVDRIGNPLVNEWVIGAGSRAAWGNAAPAQDAHYAQRYEDPGLARILNAIYGIAIPPPPRTDLALLTSYVPPIAAPGTHPGPTADLLRLNTGVSPTPMASRKRLGLLAGDPAGYPNGRRVSDDVVDIDLRVFAGILAGAAYGYALGDGVNTNDVPLQETFPYVAWAQSGRERRHIDPGEPGCTQGAGTPCPTD